MQLSYSKQAGSCALLEVRFWREAVGLCGSLDYGGIDVFVKHGWSWLLGVRSLDYLAFIHHHGVTSRVLGKSRPVLPACMHMIILPICMVTAASALQLPFVPADNVAVTRQGNLHLPSRLCPSWDSSASRSTLTECINGCRTHRSD